MDNQILRIITVNKEYKLWLSYLSQWKSVKPYRGARWEPHWYMESSQRMGSHPDMGRTLRLLLMGLSNHSCAGVVQMDRVSAFQAEDTGSSPVTCSRHTPVAQRTEQQISNLRCRRFESLLACQRDRLEICLLKIKRKSNFIRLRCGS